MICIVTFVVVVIISSVSFSYDHCILHKTNGMFRWFYFFIYKLQCCCLNVFIDVIVVVIIIGITLGIEYGSYNVMNTVGLAAYYFLYLYFAFDLWYSIFQQRYK